MKLPCHHPHDSGRDITGIHQESAKESNRSRLQSKPEPVVMAAFAQRKVTIRIIQAEVPRQLLFRWLSGKAAVAFLLFGSWEV